MRDVSLPFDDGTIFEACDDADTEMWSVYDRSRVTETRAGCECITDGPPANMARAKAIPGHLGQRLGLPPHGDILNVEDDKRRDRI